MSAGQRAAGHHLQGHGGPQRLWWRERWMEAVWSSSLRALPKVVAAVFADHAKDREVAWVTLDRLVQRSGLSRDAANRALRCLVTDGWLVVVKKGTQHNSTRYRLAIPESQQSGSRTAQRSARRTTEVSSGTPPDTSGTPPGTSGPRGVLNLTAYLMTNPTVSAPVIGNRNGGKGHPHEEHARRAIATLLADRTLPFTGDVLLEMAYRVGADGDPWSGYLTIKTATRTTFDGVHDPLAVLRKRLGVTR